MSSSLMADKEHHFLTIGTFIHLTAAKILPFKHGDTDSTVILPGEAIDTAFTIVIQTGEQLIDGYVEYVSHSRKQGHIRTGYLTLPFGYGLRGYPQTVCQELLGQPRRAA